MPTDRSAELEQLKLKLEQTQDELAAAKAAAKAASIKALEGIDTAEQETRTVVNEMKQAANTKIAALQAELDDANRSAEQDRQLLNRTIDELSQAICIYVCVVRVGRVFFFCDHEGTRSNFCAETHDSRGGGGHAASNDAAGDIRDGRSAG